MREALLHRPAGRLRVEYRPSIAHEPLKNQFGPDVARRIAEMVHGAHPAFRTDRFLREALAGYEDLELTARARQIARALHAHLPASYPDAVGILLASLGPRIAGTEAEGMSGFLYLPHVFFVAEFGLDHFEESMRAQYELTQRFTAEFSIRAFLERDTARTLERLEVWAHDPNPHVRRLVSEGTRPRLPWAPRLRLFQREPAPVIALLDLLKDDATLMVRRSVANNLNDVAKDHPDLVVEVASRWLQDAPPEREWVVRHGLRTLVKRGDAGALAVLGFGTDGRTAEVADVRIVPGEPRIGERVRITFAVINSGDRDTDVLVDLRVHFVRATGATSPKVFKVGTARLVPGETTRMSKSISLAQHTTRTHYPGRHAVEALVNGTTVPLGAFTLVAP